MKQNQKTKTLIRAKETEQEREKATLTHAP